MNKDQAEKETQALRAFAKTNQIKQLPQKCTRCQGYGYLFKYDQIYGDYTTICNNCRGTGERIIK